MGKARVLLADDHTPVVDAFRKLESGVEIVGTVTDGRALLNTARRLKPDIVVINLGMELSDGMVTAHELKRHLPQSKLIVIAVNDNFDPAIDALRHWASACLLEGSSGLELARAIREVLRGKSYVTPKVARRLLEMLVVDPQAAPIKSLTPRQREVLQLLAEGRTMKQVATILNLATRTIAFHKYRIMEEFGLKTNSDLIRFAIREHVLT